MSPTLPSAPATRAPPPTPDPGLPRFSNGAAVAAVLALLPLFGGLTLALGDAASDVDDDTIGVVMGVAAAGAFAGFAWAITTVVRLSRTHVTQRARGRWLAAVAIPVSLVSSMFGALLAVLATVSFSRGRQLRERGRPLFAPLLDTADDANDAHGWLAADDHDRVRNLEPGALAVPDTERGGVADAWRAAGKTEHASVGAFAKLAAQLVSLGAPARLVEDAHRDAIDEIRHARLCFSLARAIDGRDLEPGALPGMETASLLRFSRTAMIAHLAVESLIDGALNEGTSARAVAKLARHVTDARVRHVLLAIARDEGRHAAHGWHVLEWCLRAGGEPVRAAVRGALRALPSTMGTSLVDDADDARWEQWGLPGRAVTEQSFAEVRASLMLRATALVAERADDDAARTAA